MKAGTLEIQIITDVLRLQKDMRAMQNAVGQATGSAQASFNRTGAAASKMAADAQGAARAATQMAGDIQRLKAQLDPAWQAQQRYNQQLELGKRAFQSGAIDRQQFIQHMRQINAELKGIDNPMQQVTKSANMQRAGMTQLSFQLNDVATMYAMGSKPMQIFASQAGQVTQAVQMMSGGTSKLATFLGGPWGMAITTAVVVLVPFISKLFETKDALDDVGKAAVDAMAKLRQSLAQASAVSTAATSVIKEQMELRGQIGRLEADIARRSGGRTQTDGTPMFAHKQHQELLELQGKLSDSERRLLEVRQIANTVIPMQTANQAKLNETTDKSTTSRTRLTDAERAHAKALRDAKRDHDQLIESAENYAEQLEDQAAKFGKSSIEIQRMEVAAKAAAAPTAELATRIREAGAALDALHVAKATDDFKKLIKSLDDEVAMVGLTGTAREIAALQLEEEAKRADWLAQGLTNVNGLWLQYYMRRLDIINAEDAIRKDKEAVEKLNESLRQTVNILDGIGAKGLGNIGALLVGLQSGDFSGLRGKLGGIFGMADQMMGGDGALKKALESVFGDKAENIAGPINKALQGAGMGIAAGAIFLGDRGSKTGSGIGGVLGGKLGEKFLSEGLEKITEGLGDFAGPLGSIAGGILGGVVGGLFKKTKSGAANITGMGAASLSDNSSAFQANAGGAASSVQDGLAAIAKQLGGGVGGFNVTIGQRHGDWRVRTGAGSLKIKKGAKEFDDDEAGAIKYAISLAIQQGAITGLRAATQRLLKGGTDIEAQLQKALSFQAVFDELEQRTDPVAFELKQIGKEFEGLTAIFREAGASADEYAKLEELFAMKRCDAMKDSAESLREFMDSLAFGSNSPLSLRQQSSASLASLQPFLDSINAGKSIDQDKYLSAAQSYLDIQRQINGSGQGFFDAFEMIRSATNKAIDSAENVATLEVSSNATAQNTADIANMTADTNHLLEEIRDRLARNESLPSGWASQIRGFVN